MRGGGGKRERRGRADQMSAPEDENELDWQLRLFAFKNILYEGEKESNLKTQVRK